MSRRLGEILVESGRITEAQLHRALTAQLVFGGHLGTTLLELGYLTENTLGTTLSSIFGVPYADYEMLSKVPYAVIRCLPAKMVEKHKVLPLSLDGRTLRLAMIDPKNLMALDEISFVTGYHIEPCVSPEINILQALEFYYNLRRSQRYVTLAREMSRQRSRAESLPAVGDAGPGGQGQARAAVAAAGGSVSKSGPSVNTAGAVALPADHWEKYGYGRSWRELADALDDDGGPAQRSEEADTRPQVRATPRAAAAVASLDSQPPSEARALPAEEEARPSEAAETAPTLLEASRRLASAESVDEIVSTVLGYTADRLPRCLFFVMKGDSAKGWAGRGEGLTEEKARRLSVPLRGSEGDSIFSLVSEGATHYLGPVSNAPGVREFYRMLGLTPPWSVLIVPVMVKGRVTAYLYGDGGTRGPLVLTLPSMLALCECAGMALQIIILRNKILSAQKT
jgi:hypothetical protein